MKLPWTIWPCRAPARVKAASGEIPARHGARPRPGRLAALLLRCPGPGGDPAYRCPEGPLHPGLPGRAGSGLRQRLLEIGDQVVRMLQADADAQQVPGALAHAAFDRGAV